MKKIFTIVALMLLCQGFLLAQTATPTSENKVDSKYVKDFQKKAPGAKDVKWFQYADNKTFRVNFVSEENERQAILFSAKGTETFFYIEEEYIPQTIKKYLADNYAKYSLTDFYAAKSTKTIVYRARIAKKSGFLWWKKDTNAKLVNFSIDGKFIDAVDE